ncbi:RTA1-domain-containing protein [Artomyces pyxidatus]|uniref:RTA1-domain-containing protein n=1 Tax=Artomyces pyxidatus TaxID=48021 RepID=A0ACB8SI65_9AGAM|nr:RTA1-domain-containing protein [Artomyces pyxidatus]
MGSSAESEYHYVPTEWICALFIALYSLSTLIHVGQAAWYRMWWLFPTAVCAGILEILGWSGRLWSSLNHTLFGPYIMQITTTIIAPTPLVAANFIILGRIIGCLGDRYSCLNAKWYTIVFVSCDVIALTVQSVGGATASNADNDLHKANIGGNIMLGGIVFQLVAIVFYVALAGEFLFRYIKDRPFLRSGSVLQRRGSTTQRMKILLGGMSFMTVCIFIRSIYRTIELSDGWDGKIMSTQVLFNVLDGAMICLAMFTLNACHPGFLLKPDVIHTGSPDWQMGTLPITLQKESVDTKVENVI